MADEVLAEQATSPMRRSSRSGGMVLRHTTTKTNRNEAAFYAFADTLNGGWAVISADTRTRSVLCYSTTGDFDYENLNPAFRWWLGHYEEEISAVSAADAPTGTDPDEELDPISPLLGDILWDQELPYNQFCPIDKYDSTRCLTGCVATAAAQICRYWRYPEHGTGQKTYTWHNRYASQSETLFADYENTYYDWDNMLPQYRLGQYTEEQGEAVATLMLHCGIACDMQYGGQSVGGSGAYTDDMGDGLVKYMGYKYDKYMSMYYGNNSYSRFEEAFHQDLEMGRPIQMGGHDTNGGGGHEFVCDGRDGKGRFHINWGWSGNSNCYCTLSSLKPSGTSYVFSSNIDAVIGLEPSNRTYDTIAVEAVTLDEHELTMDIHEKRVLAAAVWPEDATIKKIDWSSTDEAIATVNKGIVEAHSTGEAMVIARSRQSGVADTCVIFVTTDTIQWVLVADTIGYQQVNAVQPGKEKHFEDLSLTAATYAGNCQIQGERMLFHSAPHLSAIYSTESNGALREVKIHWSNRTSAHANASVEICLSQSPFENEDDVWSSPAYEICNYGGQDETIVLPIRGEYSHVGIRPAGGSLYLMEVVFVWEQVLPKPDPQALETPEAAEVVTKQMTNGVLTIRKNGKTFTILGTQL